MKVLIVENEERIFEAIALHLREEGILCEIAHTYSSAIEKAAADHYDRLIIDINLPEGSSFDIVEKLKEITKDTGVIINSAQASASKLNEYEVDATDILSKPVKLPEYKAPLKSFKRRETKEIIIGELKIIPSLYEVYISNVIVGLTKKEFELLLFFVTNRNRIITKEAIIEFLWKDNKGPVDSFHFIYTHIKNLRKKMMAVGGKYYIQNIHRLGYRFKAD